MIFNCNQAVLWMVFSLRLSVCLSVRLSVCPSVKPFWLCFYHLIIMKFSEVVTTDQGKVHAKGQGQKSKVKVTEVTTQLNRFQTVTPVWIHIWWWNGAYSFMMLRRGALLFSRSFVKFQGHMALKIIEFDLDLAFPDCNSSLNSLMSTKWYNKAWSSIEWGALLFLKVIHLISRSHDSKKRRIWPKLGVSGL